MDHIVVLFFHFFEESPYCFSQWLNQFTSPPTVHKSSLFSISLPTLFFFFFHLLAILTGVRWYCSFGLDSLWLPLMNDIEYFVIYLLAICMGKCQFRSSAYILIGFCFFCYWVMWLHIFWILILIRYMICKYFVLFSRLPFHFIDGLLCWAELF